MSSEFERIARLKALFEQTSAAGVTLGIGDDAAVLAPAAWPRVWTVDTAVEDVHFSRAFMSLEDIGFRAFMAAASDVAAMGGQALAALSALVLPATLADSELDQLARGLADAAVHCACPIVGGNLTRGRELSLTTTVLGECRGQVLTRAGAQPGDGVFVTGALGGPALGLLALQHGYGSDPLFAIAFARFLRPTARLDLAAQVARCAHACIDLSDGLAQDLAHVSRASRVGIEIDWEALPLIPELQEGADRLGADLPQLVLGGGEEYELVFTGPPEGVPRELATRIGRVIAGPAQLNILDGAGRPIALPRGFDHFR